MMNYFVYILAGTDSEPLKIGLTDDLMKGIYESNRHSKNAANQRQRKLLHYETFDDPVKAKLRKKYLENYILKNKN